MNFKDWLNLRYDIDAASRNKRIESSFLSALREQEVSIVDLGAGTGSNFRYYHDKIKSPKQYWYLVDQGHELLEETLINLKKEGVKISKREGQKISLSKGDKTYTLELVIADIFSTEVDPFLEKAEIILSNAFFDLASEEQLLEFMKKLRPQQHFLATINYVGMSFEPASEKDQFWIEKYESHMQRERPEGVSSGPNCITYMKEILPSLGLNYQLEESNWRLDPKDPVNEGIFDFMRDAFQDMGEDVASFEKWKSKKSNSSMKVFHQDILL